MRKILASTAMICLLGISNLSYAAAPGEPTNKSLCVNILSRGAVQNKDSTNSIQDALNLAKIRSTNRCVYVPSGTFIITKILVDSVRLIGDGDTSILYSPDPATRQVWLGGTDAGIYKLKIYTSGNVRTNINEAVWIDGKAKNFVIDSNTIDGGNGPGIITYGGSYGRITQNTVMNTLSDSIHMSGGANHLYVAGNKIRNSGDDMIAVVTYEYHPVNTNEILIENNDVANQLWGRGISVVGGDKITIRGNKVSKASDAGIYLSAESSWVTRGDRNILIYNNTIDQSPYAHAADHGQTSILVYSDNSYYIQDVFLNSNKITNAPVAGPIRIEPHNVINVACSGNIYNGVSYTPNNCKGSSRNVTGTSVTSSILGGTTVLPPK